jgi:hypothetical protein
MDAQQKLDAIAERAKEWREIARHLTYDPNIATAFARCAEQVEDIINKED